MTIEDSCWLFITLHLHLLELVLVVAADVGATIRAHSVYVPQPATNCGLTRLFITLKAATEKPLKPTQKNTKWPDTTTRPQLDTPVEDVIEPRHPAIEPASEPLFVVRDDLHLRPIV